MGYITVTAKKLQEHYQFIFCDQTWEDDLKDAEKKMQTLTDKYCKEVDELSEKKQKEIMEIQPPTLIMLQLCCTPRQVPYV